MNNLAINGEKFIVDYLGIYIIQETDVLYDKGHTYFESIHFWYINHKIKIPVKSLA